MNVRRGLFRLWVVVSFLFVISVSIVSYTSLRDGFRNAYIDWDAEASKYGGWTVLPVGCAWARGNVGSDYTNSNNGFCWYETATFRRLYPEYKDLSNASLSDKVYAKAKKSLKHSHPWVMVMEITGIAIGVPLAVLALCAALFWAGAGFHDRAKQPARAGHIPTL